MYGMKLLIYSQMSTVQLIEFREGYVISSHILLVIWLRFHAGIKDKSC